MAAQPLAVHLGVAPACQALGVSRATFYRRQRPTPGHQQPRPTPARALCESEREHVLNVLASPRFVDRAPAEVAATLLDEGQYLCSERTMYRILAANQPVRERRNQRDHPQYTKPELVATGPNQTWSWDITKLLGPKKWTYFYLYVVLDIFSRYAVGWMVADRENSALAGRLIEQTCHKQGVQPQVLTLHSDRGAPMTSKCTAQLLADLGITRSLSRPQVSDDNPFSEAQFKTLKYHPGFPGRFDNIHAAIAFCRSFFPWYNTEHRHGGIAMLTPDDVHHGRAHTVLQQREQTLRDAWDHHPERFVRGIPKPLPIPEAVWINPPATSTSTTGETGSVNRNRRCLKVVDRFRDSVLRSPPPHRQFSDVSLHGRHPPLLFRSPVPLRDRLVGRDARPRPSSAATSAAQTLPDSPTSEASYPSLTSSDMNLATAPAWIRDPRMSSHRRPRRANPHSVRAPRE